MLWERHAITIEDEAVNQAIHIEPVHTSRGDSLTHDDVLEQQQSEAEGSDNSSTVSLSTILRPDPDSQDMIRQVRDSTRLVRDKMANRYNKKQVETTFKVGDNGSIEIPKKNRKPIDPRRIFGIVCQKPHPSRYIVRCKHCIISRAFVAKDIERLAASINTGITQDSPLTKISIALASKRACSSLVIEVRTPTPHGDIIY